MLKENQYIQQYDDELMSYIDCINKQKQKFWYRMARKLSFTSDCLRKGDIKKLYSKISKNHKLKKIKKYNCKTEWDISKVSNNMFLNERIAIYTVIFGKYDKIYQPHFCPDNCDFFIITDQEYNDSEMVYKKKNYDKNLVKGFSAVKKNRFFKMNPHKIFPEYKYSIYVDGNIEILADLTRFINSIQAYGIAFFAHTARDCIYNEIEACRILNKGNMKILRKQINTYKKAGFPIKYGMVEANVIARMHNKNKCIELMDQWWEEFCRWESRDQISLPYIMWKNNIPMSAVISLGSDVNAENRVIIHEHK